MKHRKSVKKQLGMSTFMTSGTRSHEKPIGAHDFWKNALQPVRKVAKKMAKTRATARRSS